VRRVALRALLEIERGGNSSQVLDRLLNRIPPGERPFVTEIVMGVLRWRNRLDYAIAYFSKKRLDRLEPQVINALRMALYEVQNMHTPEYAVVKETVSLLRGSWRRAFVNGILRNYLREGVRYPGRDNPLMYLTYTLSVPEWKALRWLDEYGLEKAEKLAHFYNSPPPIYLRVNRRKTSPEKLMGILQREGMVVEPCSCVPFCLKVIEGNPRNSRALKTGMFYIQDIASQIAGFIAAELGTKVWDCCAAPGGKASHLAEIGLKVFASDISLPRLRLSHDNFKRLGVKIYGFVADAKKPPLKERFPMILVDAPCSSMGIAHRAPEVKWRITPEKLKELSRLQREILNAILPYGEKILYVVCTREREETVDVMDGLKTERVPLNFAQCEIPFFRKGEILFTEPALMKSDGMAYSLVLS